MTTKKSRKLCPSKPCRVVGKHDLHIGPDGHGGTMWWTDEMKTGLENEARAIREKIMKVVQERDVEPMGEFARCINVAFGLPEEDGLK